MQDAANKPAAPAASEDRSPGVVALTLCTLLIFLVFSRATEFIRIPKLILIVSCLALAAACLGTELFRVAASRLGVLMAAFTFWMALSIPFAWWKGGALAAFNGWLPNVILFFAGAQVATNLKSVRKLAYAVALATIFVVAVTFTDAMAVKDRLALASGGSIGNANDLAASLLIGAPLCMAYGLRSKFVRRMAGFASFGMAILMTLRTGSRAGLLTVFVLALSVFLTLSPGKKILFVICALLMGLAGAAALPEGVKGRYRTIFQGSGGDSQSEAAAGAMAEARMSSEQRTTMLKQSVKLTFQHPLLGVGPGQFVYANNDDLVANSQRKAWLVSHNSYTQVSSELGLPGFAVYMAILVHCFRITFRVRKLAAGRPETREAANLTFCVRLSLIAYCVTSMFLTVAYKFYLPILAVLACGLEAWAATAFGTLRWTPPVSARLPNGVSRGTR